MRTRIVASIVGIGFIVSTALLAACGGGSDGPVDKTKTLPTDSTVSLAKVSSADPKAEGKVYLGDATNGDIFQMKVKDNAWLVPYQWVSPTRLIARGYMNDFYLLDLDARTLHRLPALVPDANASFSHSGDYMAYQNPTGGIAIWSITDNKELGEFATGQVGWMTWSPDDKRILYAGTPSGVATVEATPKTVNVDLGQQAMTATWSNDGSAIIYNAGDGLYSVNADTGAKTLLYAWPAGTQPITEQPELSYDGKYALITAKNADTGGFRLLIVPLDGSSKAVQVSAAWAKDADWSPTQDVVAVVADWCKPASRLMLVNPDGSIRSTVEGATQIPAFSPDGSKVAYVGPDPASGVSADAGLLVKSADASGDPTLLKGIFRDDLWSPDGHWIAYTPGPSTYECTEVGTGSQVLPFP